MIQFTVSSSDMKSEFEFRVWNYAQISIRLSFIERDISVCADMKCEVSLMNKAWVKSKLSELTIIKMTSSLRMRDVNVIKHETDEYIIVSIYLSEINEFDNQVLAVIIKELHLINDLRVKMLIKNDILESKDIFINISQKQTFIDSCKVKVEIYVKQRDDYVRRKILIKKVITVSSHFEVIIFIRASSVLSQNRDFLF